MTEPTIQLLLAVSLPVIFYIGERVYRALHDLRELLRDIERLR